MLLNFRNIHRKTPALESRFNKVAGLKDIPVNIAKFLELRILRILFHRTPRVTASEVCFPDRKIVWKHFLRYITKTDNFLYVEIPNQTVLGILYPTFSKIF